MMVSQSCRVEAFFETAKFRKAGAFHLFSTMYYISICGWWAVKLVWHDSVTEWLRWWTRNPLGSARRGSNPLAVAFCFQAAIVQFLCLTRPHLCGSCLWSTHQQQEAPKAKQSGMEKIRFTQNKSKMFWFSKLGKFLVLESKRKIAKKSCQTCSFFLNSASVNFGCSKHVRWNRRLPIFLSLPPPGGREEKISSSLSPPPPPARPRPRPPSRIHPPPLHPALCCSPHRRYPYRHEMPTHKMAPPRQEK